MVYLEDWILHRLVNWTSVRSNGGLSAGCALHVVEESPSITLQHITVYQVSRLLLSLGLKKQSYIVFYCLLGSLS